MFLLKLYIFYLDKCFFWNWRWKTSEILEGRTDQKTDQKVVDVAVQLGVGYTGIPTKQEDYSFSIYSPPKANMEPENHLKMNRKIIWSIHQTPDVLDSMRSFATFLLRRMEVSKAFRTGDTNFSFHPSGCFWIETNTHLGGVATQIFLISTPKIWGRWTQFDAHVFSDGLVETTNKSMFWIILLAKRSSEAGRNMV